MLFSRFTDTFGLTAAFLIFAIVLQFFCIPTIKASAYKPIDLATHPHDEPLGKHAKLYLDPNIDSGIQDAIQVTSGKWHPVNSDIINLGHSRQVVWLKFNLKNSGIKKEEVFLSFDLPTMNDYQFYLVIDNSIVQSVSLGDLKPFSQRIIENRNFVVPFSLEQQTSATLYLRFQTHESIQIPLFLRNLQEFERHEHESTLFQGVYLGIMLIMILYNFSIYFSVKDKSFLFISLYIFSESIYQLAKSGIGFQHIWPDSPLVNNYIIVSSIGMMTLSLSVFMYHFLQIEKHHKVIHRTLLSLIILSLTVPFVSLFSLHHSTNIINLLAFLTITSGMIITYKRYRDGLKYAQLFVIGFAVLLFSLMLLVLNKVGIIPRNFFTENGSQIADIITVLLMSMALVQRIKFVQYQKRKAEKEAKKKNEELKLEKERYQQLKVQARLDEIKTKEKIVMAKAESKAKSDFLATMSHEIRTPMNGVMGMIEVLSGTNLNNEQQHYVDVIQESGNSLLKVINDILDFSKIESGKLELEMIDFDLKRLIQDCISNFSIEAKNKSIELTSRFSTSTSLLLHSDPTRIKQILLNLISNALKFTFEGSINICVSRVPNAKDINTPYLLRVEVSDTGIGISDEQKEKLFSEFSQADSSTTRIYGGSGLGLAICKQLCELLGGEIGVESELEVGSSFWFTLPLREAQQQYQPDNSHILNGDNFSRNQKAQLEQDFQKYTDKLSGSVALVAEDNLTNQLVINKMLQKLGVSVTIVGDGEQTFDYYKAHVNELDFILMDCEMPLLDGYQTTTKIREYEALNKLKAMPIIALTAHALKEHKKKALDYGMNDHISKPVNINELALSIYNQL